MTVSNPTQGENTVSADRNSAFLRGLIAFSVTVSGAGRGILATFSRAPSGVAPLEQSQGMDPPLNTGPNPLGNNALK